MSRNDWSYEALVDRIRSPLAAAVILLGMFLGMSLVAAGIVHLLTPTEVDVQTKPSIVHSPEAGTKFLAGAGATPPKAEDTNGYAN